GGLLRGPGPILRVVLPGAEIVVIDRSAASLESARRFLGDDVDCIHACYEPALVAGFDLTIIPLAFVGDRSEIYQQPPTATVLVHDWAWHRRGAGTIVSLLLLKRLNLVTR